MAELSITVDVSEAAKMLDSIQVEKRQRAAMEESLAYLQSEVRAGMPVDQGIGRGSVFAEVRGSAANLRGVVGSAQLHVAVLEKGRRPGSTPPPVGPIRAWLARKGGDARLAFVVARSIGRRGTKAHRMFQKTAEKGQGRVEMIFRKHFQL